MYSIGFMSGRALYFGKEADWFPEEGPGCKGNGFASDKGTFAFSSETSKRELEGWGRRGKGGRAGRCGR